MAAPSVIDDLSRWGPHVQSPPLSVSEAERYCRALATSHYENFPVVSWFLPRSLHQHFFNVYAWCRWADDLGDEAGGRERAKSLLKWWRDELLCCYDGTATHPVSLALRPTIQQFNIPQQLFLDLISAFEQDQNVLRYDTFDQLLDYCRRSANPVGRIVLHLCERFNEENGRWSDSICTGLQLANFWQDVARDFEIGRVYLPKEDREHFGYSDDDLENHRTTPEFQELMKFEVDRAREFLLAGQPLVRQMPGRLKIDIDLFIRGGLLILRGVERIEYRVWEQRPIVRKSEFAVESLKALFRIGGLR